MKGPGCEESLKGPVDGCWRWCALPFRTNKAGRAVVGTDTAMVGIGFKVEAALDTRSLPGRAVQHAVTIDAGLPPRTCIAAVTAVAAVGEGIRTVRAAETAVCRADSMLWGCYGCQDCSW